MKQTTRDTSENSQAPPDHDRRDCKRVPLTFPIKVSGIDFKGRPFCDLSVTTDVSDRGCRFDLLRTIELDDVLTIQIVDRNGGTTSEGKAAQFRVAWIWPGERGFSIGVTLLHPENFWHIIFPKRKTP